MAELTYDLSATAMEMAQDAGAQPLVWRGSKTGTAETELTPTGIRKGTFGATRDQIVSPQHRVLVRDPSAEILTLFPELDPLTGIGYGAPARPLLRSFEASLLQRRAA
ncbi:Hint domain-containing protein [Thioclava sp. 15-R06ZXC-3]|uniref:Hint domain-containing protein n=1 Tax=Thioclava arctica TaxID=3238301 RepID=A0ABV3TLC9_9RHOB